MTTKELNNYILHYLKKDKTQTAIMITGEWGSGKTYYIENDLVPFLKKNKATSVVVSLYGLDNISMISKSIYIELRMSTLGGKNSETLTTGKVIAKNILKNITGLAGINFGLANDDLTELYESVNLKDKLLILEDVERSNISVTSLLGYVNGLVERDGVKVLLVANENEILKKFEQKRKCDFSELINKEKDVVEEIDIPEDVKLYLRIKEKTISDTIQFNGDFEQAIEQIIKGFDNYKLNMVFKRNQELYKMVSNTVRNICGKNLRTFIFAIQKNVDIIDKMGTNNYEDDFFECLMFGIIYLSAKIKADEFPKWEGNVALSTTLGTNDAPLMRFAYDYIRWQTFDLATVEKAYEAYKDFRFFERHAEYKDEDLKVLGNYSEETEENVLEALKNVEIKLHTPDMIGIHAYCKLAYYMIYVGSVVGFDYKKSCELMLKNVEGIGMRAGISADLFYAHTYSIEDDAIKEKYEEYVKKLADAVGHENEQVDFSYEPNTLYEFYVDVCKNREEYIYGHRFISKYSIVRISEMLLNCTSKQIQDFRGILFAMYRYAGKNDFDESDVDALRKLLNLVKEARNGEHNWDKIQLMQINWLCMNLKDFIRQMEG